MMSHVVGSNALGIEDYQAEEQEQRPILMMDDDHEEDGIVDTHHPHLPHHTNGGTGGSHGAAAEYNLEYYQDAPIYYNDNNLNGIGSSNETNTAFSKYPPASSTGFDTNHAQQQRQASVAPSSSPQPQPLKTKTAKSVATLSSPWQYDTLTKYCHGCQEEFHPFHRRRHHCRLCGKIFCHECSSQRALIPPSSIVLIPKGGKKVKPMENNNHYSSLAPDPDPDRMLTYLSGGDANELLYGKGLEERFKLAREPLRVCRACFKQLAPYQEDLRASNSNAMRFNHIDPTDVRRFFNSPIAHTLGHEIRKAAYTLNNLLPQPRRRPPRAFTATPTTTASSSSPSFPYFDDNEHPGGGDLDCVKCQEECANLSPNLGNLDGIQIPARLLEQAKGIAFLTVLKGGLGLAGFEFGTGLVVARTSSSSSSFGPSVAASPNSSHSSSGGHSEMGSRWSAPSAIAMGGVSWGALVGAQVSDHIFLCMTDAAVHMFFSNKGQSIQLGADIGIAVGPLGRAVEGNIGASAAQAHAHSNGVGGGPPGMGGGGNHAGRGGGNKAVVAPIYSYSFSKGLYAGISLDGKVVWTRNQVNEKFYGRSVTGPEILAGAVPLPPAAQPLYEALARCHVYAHQASSNRHHLQHRPPSTALSSTSYPSPLHSPPPPHLSIPPPLHPNNTTTTTTAATNDNGLLRLQQEQEQHSFYYQQQQYERQQQYEELFGSSPLSLPSMSSSVLYPTQQPPSSSSAPEEGGQPTVALDDPSQPPPPQVSPPPPPDHIVAVVASDSDTPKMEEEEASFNTININEPTAAAVDDETNNNNVTPQPSQINQP